MRIDMAEWAVLIMVFAVVAGAYWLSRRFFETWRVIAIWVGAGLIIVTGLIIYVFSKVEATGNPWETQYEIEDL